MAGAIDWFFQDVSEGIVLENDILASPSFFPCCAELLEKYRDEPRVGLIAGVTVGRRGLPGGASQRFSRLVPLWGWASWRRAWRVNDAQLRLWPGSPSPPWLEEIGGARFAVDMRRFLDGVASGEIDTWDYGWLLSCWRTGMVGCLPAVNLVNNLGFEDLWTTHCQRGRSPLPPAGELSLPLNHPPLLPLEPFPSPKADVLLFEWLYAPSLVLRAWRRLGC